MVYGCLVLGCNNGGGGGIFLQVKRLVRSASQHGNGFSHCFLVFGSFMAEFGNAGSFRQKNVFYP